METTILDNLANEWAKEMQSYGRNKRKSFDLLPRLKWPKHVWVRYEDENRSIHSRHYDEGRYCHYPNLEYTHVNEVVAQSSNQVHGHAYPDGAVTRSRDRSPSLAIVQVNASYKESPTVIPVTNLGQYTEE